MRNTFYLRLATDGIRKNKRLYVPYILIGAVMVMMYYILHFLSVSTLVGSMPGGGSVQGILSLGPGVLAFFSLLFLFYTNSFLVRSRYREFGLYHILGMDKRNIRRVMIWEGIFVAFFVLGIGLIVGILFSKLSELALLKLLHMDVSYALQISLSSLRDTLLIYGGIYLLLLLNSLVRVSCSNPLELMKSDQIGEKPPKGNLFLALLGVILLALAYYLAVSIEEPLTAFTVFFGAVLMVIVATYLIFISASVVFCRLLQKNKGYYYKPNHFVSVSSMVYRMKRNGAGLASICILLTMVLVTFSFTSGLYLGVEDMIENRYPNDVNVTAQLCDAENAGDGIRQQLCDDVIAAVGEPVLLDDCCTAEVNGFFTDCGILIDSADFESANLLKNIISYENIGILQVISLADYNRIMGTNEMLAEDECLIYCLRMDYPNDTFAIDDGFAWNVKEVLPEFIPDGSLSIQAVPSLSMVVNDINAVLQPIEGKKDQNGSELVHYFWKCGFDLKASAENKIAIGENVDNAMKRLEEDGTVLSGEAESREATRDAFYQLFGSLLFIGIVLSLIFLISAVMIIYYKQISEGYEDQARFAVMRKVGMTQREIRSSINSQMLTVFFLPILFAGIHLAFAFPLLWKLMQLFNLYNVKLAICVTLGCFALFALLYIVVYKITSDSYYAIVSSDEE